ncbi:DUF6056 family protein [Pinibacter aurantiacus]|uniref:YfhO family protein n=1 Tax=Pinibacter aurantiacus TaxID=2851599 RepID=A0A9E2S8P3_9BACT|nr:DUF6056 family protein [Pinibacter aurantiacus]MBV4356968.1 hypothetical protein [Pinibacter aurantiacus]
MKVKSVRLLPWLSIAVLLIPLIVLCFFNHPSADDYVGAGVCRDGLFFQKYRDLYLYWQGRYFSQALGMYGSFIEVNYNLYWLHPIVLFILTLWGIYFLLSQLLRYLFKVHLSFSLKLLATFLFFFLNFFVQPSMAESVYWLSSSLGYYLAFTLLLFWLGLFISYNYNNGKRKTDLFLLAILSFLICGSNELIAIALVLFCIVGCLFSYRLKKSMRPVAAILLITMVATALEIFSPGSTSRSTVIGKKDLVKIIFSFCYWGSQVYISILKEPLSWASAAAAVLLGTRYRESVHTNIKRNGWLHLFLIFFSIICISPILYGSNGSMPLRMLNNVVSMQLLLLLAECFLLGTLIRSSEITAILQAAKFKTAYFYALSAILLLSSTFTFNLYDNLIQGFFYDKMMSHNEYLKKTNDALYEEKVIRNYSTFVEEEIKNYPALNKEVFIQKAKQLPSFLFFYNDFENQQTEKVFLNKYYR